MSVDNIEDRLKALDDTFKEASAESNRWELPEPGTYLATFFDVDFFENNKGQAMLKMQYVIVRDSKYEGRTVDVLYNLEPDGGQEDVQRKLGFLKRDLKKLGIDVDANDFSLMAVRPGSEMWDTLTDAPVELAIVDSKKINTDTNKPYRNVYLNERLDSLPALTDVPGEVPAQRPVGAVSVDDIPF